MALKKLLPFIFFISIATHAQKYTPGDAGSKVHFTIKNFGIKTGGDLGGLKGEIYFFKTDLAACRFAGRAFGDGGRGVVACAAE